MQETIDRLGNLYKKYVSASTNTDDFSRPERLRYARIAKRIRLQLNRLIYRGRSRVFYGNEIYFMDEGAVTGSDRAKSMILQREYE